MYHVGVNYLPIQNRENRRGQRQQFHGCPKLLVAGWNLLKLSIRSKKMTSKFYDLEISKLDDGTIRLEQRYGCDESAIVDLHPAQVAYIADGLPATAPERPQPQWAMERIATLERRLLWMRDRFDDCYAALPHDMCERCPEAPEFYAWLQASIDVAGEFCSDFPDAPSITPSNAHASPLEAPGDSFDGVCQPSVAERDSAHPERGNADLFAVA